MCEAKTTQLVKIVSRRAVESRSELSFRDYSVVSLVSGASSVLRLLLLPPSRTCNFLRSFELLVEPTIAHGTRAYARLRESSDHAYPSCESEFSLFQLFYLKYFFSILFSNQLHISLNFFLFFFFKHLYSTLTSVPYDFSRCNSET